MTDPGRRRARRPALPLALLLAGGCAATPEADPPEPQPAQEERREWLTTAGGAYVVAYRPSPDPIPLNEPFALLVWVRAVDGAPSAGCALAVDATMPEHGHGMNLVPRVERLGDGAFRAEGLLLHMGGEWELVFDVTQGGVTERAATAIEPR